MAATGKTDIYGVWVGCRNAWRESEGRMWACVEALVACDCMANQRHVKEADLQEIAPVKARKACSQLPL